jgi:predicted Zn-dependent protease
MRAFYDMVEQIRQAGQHDAKRLISKLMRKHPLDGTGNIIGYLGITEHDIFAKDYNFLYGWGGKGHAVMSYHRFMAAFNREPPNRPRLIERATKQAISSSFFILGIPRCTSPLCARAYPHNLTEHDQKTSQLCEGCRRNLEWTLARHR